MNPRELPARLNRLQQSRLFKIIATVVVVCAALIVVSTVGLARSKAPAVQPGPTPAVTEGSPSTEPARPDPAMDATRAIVQDIMSARRDFTSFVSAAAIITALCVGVIWLGLGLTYLALGLLIAGSVALASQWPTGKAYAPLVVGVLALTAAFTTLMQSARLLLGGPGALMAIARNVLAEATRMRLSMVFIVLVIFGLAALPFLMDAEQPLRYRVQSFLSWGTGGSYWLIALLTVLFSVATVTFDQRDKTIWQTITKPVHAWQYVLGKWLGVWVLSGVLLTVAGSGVFLFVEYLRSQDAQGEGESALQVDGMLTEDRLLLESQVLVAREARGIDPMLVNEEQFNQNVMAKAQEELARLRSEVGTDPGAMDDQHVLAQIKKSLSDSVQVMYRNIAPGNFQTYRFSGLADAKRSKRPLLFRFKVNSGSNAPDALYKVSFQFGNSPVEVKEVFLGQWQTIPLIPELVDDEGGVSVAIINGDVVQRVMNPESITFPPDGLELSFAAGSYRVNFARVMAVLWLKLGFLAMLGVCLGTFLSFPVACLVAITVLFAAEGAPFINASLENYWTEDREGKTILFNTAVSWVAKAVAWIFTVYGNLRPTGRLVEGIRLAWSEVANGTAMLAVWSVLLFFAGAISLRRRELAIYSGQ